MAGEADGVGFLECVGADQVGRDLAGDDHQRDRIHERVGDAGDRVGRAGARGHEDHAGLAGRTGIALRRMRRGLFVAHQDVLDPATAKQRVVDRQHGTTRIAEHDLHAEIAQRLDQDIGSTLLGHHVKILSNAPPLAPRGGGGYRYKRCVSNIILAI